MDTWNILEYAAWAISFGLGLWMVLDWWRTDTSFSEELLTSSREGEIEVTTEQHKL